MWGQDLISIMPTLGHAMFVSSDLHQPGTCPHSALPLQHLNLLGLTAPHMMAGSDHSRTPVLKVLTWPVQPNYCTNELLQHSRGGTPADPVLSCLGLGSEHRQAPCFLIVRRACPLSPCIKHPCAPDAMQAWICHP